MKRSSFWSFTMGFLGPFALTTLALYGASDGFRMLESGLLAQCLLLIGGVSLLIALFTAFSSLTQEENPEQADFRQEVSAELGFFLRALLLLRRRAFIPLWLAFSALAAGCAFAWHERHLPAALFLLTGQAFWLLVRGRLRNFIDNAPMDNHLYPYLLWSLRGMDAFALASISGVLTSLKGYGDVVDNISLLAASALAAVAISALSARRRQESFGIDHLLQATAAFVWIAMAVATMNFAFDFREPVRTDRLTYRACMDYRELVLAKKTPPRADMLDCHFFTRVKDPGTDSELEFVHHPGALGMEWKHGRLVR